MLHPGFFNKVGPFRAVDLALKVGAEITSSLKGTELITNVAPLSEAGPSDLSFLDNKKYLPQLEHTQAGFILIHPTFSHRVPPNAHALKTKSPYRSVALALSQFYPEALRPTETSYEVQDQLIHPSAIIEEKVTIGPDVIIGPEAMIGRGTHIASGTSIGYRVSIGRNCSIGSSVTITHSLVGDRVIIHPGVRIGQDGFGFAMSQEGHLKVPQIGRVIIQDDVEIGANSTIDRGALKDTIIGEGTKIDNLVQIGHNVVIGRHCIIVAQSGISGSTVLEDFVVMGGQSGIIGHVKIGQGAQVAGASHVKDNVPPHVAVCGTPARPLKQFAREIAALSRLSLARKDSNLEE